MARNNLETTWAGADKTVLDSSRKARREAEEAASRIKAQLDAKVDDAGAAMREGMDAAGENFDRLGETFRAGMDQASDAVGDAAKRGAKTWKRTRKVAGAQIGKRPVGALLLAGAVGYLIGYTVASRD
jgi:ElaB/YqjD/DUF883 family membrane-anchored ribosome-binding protein